MSVYSEYMQAERKFIEEVTIEATELIKRGWAIPSTAHDRATEIVRKRRADAYDRLLSKSVNG